MINLRFQQNYVFIAKFPFDTANGGLIAERQQEIENCRNEHVKSGKFFVFKLLEYAVSSIYGCSLAECNLAKNSAGKWTSDKFELSLTHCGDIAAVALSSAPIGIDVQTEDLPRFNCILRRRILTSAELAETERLTEEQSAAYANALWTVKEAVFKKNGGKVFIPSKIDVTDETYEQVTVTDGDIKYYLSVASAAQTKTEYRALNVQCIVNNNVKFLH